MRQPIAFSPWNSPLSTWLAGQSGSPPQPSDPTPRCPLVSRTAHRCFQRRSSIVSRPGTPKGKSSRRGRDPRIKRECRAQCYWFWDPQTVTGGNSSRKAGDPPAPSAFEGEGVSECPPPGREITRNMYFRVPPKGSFNHHLPPSHQARRLYDVLHEPFLKVPQDSAARGQPP